MIKKILSNKAVLIYAALLFFAVLLLFCISYGRFGLFFADTSREVYIPMAMNSGSVLYKDIFNIFTPLSYQINAFLCSIAGENLNTFYAAGFFNAVLFIWGLFAIGCLFFKKTAERFLCFVFCLFIISSCIFAVSQSNYILPYAYSAVYSLNAMVWALFCLLCYVKNKIVMPNSFRQLTLSPVLSIGEGEYFLILSFFLFGVSICFKYDYILFLPVLSGVLFYAAGEKEISKKSAAVCIAAFLMPFLISFGVLIIQGVSVPDLKQAFDYIISLTQSESSIYCYKFLGVIPNAEAFKSAFASFLQTAPVILLIFLFSYKTAAAQKLNNALKTAVLLLFSALVIFVLKPLFFISNSSYFNWTGMSAVFQFVFILVFWYKKKIELDIYDKMFFILFLSVLLISAKCLVSLNFNYYGAYYFPLLLFAVFLSIFHYLKKYFNENAFRTGFAVLFIILFLSYAVSNTERRYAAFNSEINTEKGVIYTNAEAAGAVKKVLNFIKENTGKEDKILVSPEGAMINFLSDRFSDNKYFYLIPPNIEVFGEENVIKDLENNLPDYIIWQPLSYENFNQTHFCESFGRGICGLIPKYYEAPYVFGSDFRIAVYRKK